MVTIDQESTQAGVENTAEPGTVTVVVPSPLRPKGKEQWKVSVSSLPGEPLPEKRKGSTGTSASPVKAPPRSSRLRNAGKRKAGGG